jgi:protein gp37
MAKQGKNGISWTDATWSPVVGCTRVSPGCEHCWAERMARVHYHHEFPNGWNGDVMIFPHRLLQPTHWKKPRRVAVGLMGDIFHKSVPFSYLDQIWATMGCCESPDLRHLTFQILTKRTDRMFEYAMYRAQSGMVFDLPNLWVGGSIEDQKTADERIPLLLQTPAHIRFVSVEPMIGPVNLSPFIKRDCRAVCPEENECTQCNAGFAAYMSGNQLDWVIVGGESGPGARPLHPDWVRSLRDQCIGAGVPFHFKQWGEWIEISQLGADQWTTAGTEKNGKTYGTIRSRGETLFGGKKFETMIFLNDPATGLESGEYIRTGKKAAGRLLDGREWLEFPEAA